MKQIWINEAEKELLIRALTRFLLTDNIKDNEREKAGMMLESLKEL